jgi:hypothetical protein
MARSRITLDGLPHSEIFGSKPVCGSPKLIAAYHVLHRRPAPRHPPYALSSLTTTFTLLEHCSRLQMPYTSLLLQVSSVVNEPGLKVREAALDATDQPSLRKVDRWRPRRSTGWWSWPGSNRRPPGCKPGALPAELQPLIRDGGRWPQPSLLGWGPLKAATTPVLSVESGGPKWI